MGGRQGVAGNGPLTISIEIVRCDDDHIRKSDFSIDHLRDTIADAGLLQPILARREKDHFIVIDGARRLAALKDLGVQELIVGRDIVIDAEETEADVRFKQLIANVQREDLNAVELGQAFLTLKEEFGYQYNEIAEIIGKTPHYVAAKVGLVKRLDPEVQRLYLEDLANEKGIQSTVSDEQQPPYALNVNILEDIARVPREMQLAAYLEIRERRMDKDTAIAYLRSIKQCADEAALSSQEDGATVTICTKKGREQSVRRYIHKIGRDIQRLADTMQGQARVEPEIEAEIDALIERLNELRARANAGDAAGAETGPDQA
jgi:ParB family transcriptional regulator, chromosome partitioning protein